MESVLRGKNQVEIKEMYKKSFDFTKQVVLFPVRHHSPGCSYHLKQVIEAYKPEIILIEGPDNGQDIIADLEKEVNQPPFCLYLSFDDTKGLLGQEEGKYRAYYPMLAYSPELNAIREAKKYNIPCQFIDLPYHEKLYNNEEIKDELPKEEEMDRLFTHSTYYKNLAKKMGCRNFNELWEKLFELPALATSTEDFVEGVFTYCYYSRLMTPSGELQQSGDLAREAYMKSCLIEATKKYKKILVVTGGIHTIALSQWDNHQEDNKQEDNKQEGNEKENTKNEDGQMGYKRLPVEQPPVYLMPYSFEESDANYGYQSGMPYPYFYQKLWEAMEKGRGNPYEDTLLSFIIHIAGEMRKKQATSITDEMQAFYMAKGLSELRDKVNCGVYELIDGVQSSFIKGQRNTYYEPIMDRLYRSLTGMTMGYVRDTKNTPPIVLDFLEQCRSFRLSTKVAEKKETKLDVVGKEDHLRKSQFFHQMVYLGTTFCTYEKGQEERVGVGRILLRETWKYRYTPKVQATLIDQCVYGGTIRQACTCLLERGMKSDYQTAESMSQHLLETEKMGIDELFSQLRVKLEAVLSDDMDFLSVAKCFRNLGDIYERMENRQSRGISWVKSLQSYTLRRMEILVHTISTLPKDEEDKLCDSLKFTYEYLLEHDLGEAEERWMEALYSIFEAPNTHASVIGLCGGIFLKKARLELEVVMEKFSGYLQGSEEVRKAAASFLKGFFKVAKDTVFIEPKVLKMIDTILLETSGDAFLEILPDLRLAFTYFLPFEIDKIAKEVKGFYNLGNVDLTYEKGISPKVIEEAKYLDQLAEEEQLEWFARRG